MVAVHFPFRIGGPSMGEWGASNWGHGRAAQPEAASLLSSPKRRFVPAICLPIQADAQHPQKPARSPQNAVSLWAWLFLLVALTSVTLPGHRVVLAADPAEAEKIVLGDEIFTSEKAARHVQEARQFDPMFCPPDQRDRDRAVEFYRAAIAEAPDAAISAKIADRIAQLYAFYEDPDQGVLPDPDTARSYWRATIDKTDTSQLLWSQAQMGLASAAVMSGDAATAIQAYETLLAVDPTTLDLPAWRVTRPGQEEVELERIQKRGAEMRTAAVENLGHMARRWPVAYQSLQRVGQAYRDSDVAREASNQVMQLLGINDDVLWQLPDELLEQPWEAPVEKVESDPAPAPEPRPAGFSEASTPQDSEEDGHWRWIGIGVGAVASAALGWWILARRKIFACIPVRDAA